MKRLMVFLLVCTSQLFATVEFSVFFEDKTLRVDFFHSGTSEKEFFAIDQLYKTDIWAGTKSQMITPLNLGEYQVRVFDAKSGKLIYSRGYSTIFNEWQTTPDAKKNYHTFHETILVPMPKAPIELAVFRRNKEMAFVEKWRTQIDPADDARINSNVKKPDYKVTPLMQNGPPSEKVDIVILGDGYTKDEIEQFKKDARYYNDAMFKTEPFKKRKSDFNVWLVEVISEDSGISKPDKNIWKNNALGCRYYAFNSPRYVLTEDNKALRDAAGLVPYDYINILINDTRYGGGGIYNLYTTTYMRVDTKGQEWQMEYVYVHEFGHSFAGLGDEYYSSSTGYDAFYKTGVEPWEANITALLDKDNVKWKKYIEKETPLPTPWKKKEYDNTSMERRKLDRLAPGYYAKREPLITKQNEILNNAQYKGKVGAFEGAGYEQYGLYRPSINCRMFSLSLVDFDPVCSATLEDVINYLAR